MALQLSVQVCNARLNAIAATCGPNAVLKLRTGGKPANCGAADSGTVVASMTLPSNWMAVASSGLVNLLGTWQSLSALADGTIAHFRIYDSAQTTCHLQGTVTITGGGGDMTLDVVTLTVGQQTLITTFTVTDGNL